MKSHMRTQSSNFSVNDTTNIGTSSSRTIKRLETNNNKQKCINSSFCMPKTRSSSKENSFCGFRKISIYNSNDTHMVNHLNKSNENIIKNQTNTNNNNPKFDILKLIQCELGNIKKSNDLKKYDLASAIQTLPAQNSRPDGHLTENCPIKCHKKSAIYTNPNIIRSHIIGLPGDSVFL